MNKLSLEYAIKVLKDHSKMKMKSGSKNNNDLAISEADHCEDVIAHLETEIETLGIVPAKRIAPPSKIGIKKKTPKATLKKIPKMKSEPVRTERKPNAAFMMALTPSNILADIIGSTPVPRTEAVRKVWEYIKANNRQNPRNKRNILADDKLLLLFGKKEVSIFDLAGILGKHLA